MDWIALSMKGDMKILSSLKCTDGNKWLKEIGLRVENLVINLDRLNTQHNEGGQGYDHFTGKKFLTLIMNNILIWAPKSMREMPMSMMWSC